MFRQIFQKVLLGLEVGSLEIGGLGEDEVLVAMLSSVLLRQFPEPGVLQRRADNQACDGQPEGPNDPNREPLRPNEGCDQEKADKPGKRDRGDQGGRFGTVPGAECTGPGDR